MSVDYRRPQYGKRDTRVFTVAPDNTFSLCLALLVHVGEAVCADRCLHADSFAHAGGIGCTDIVQMFSPGISSKIKQGGQAVDVGCHHPRPVCLLYTSDAADDLLCVDLGG